MGTNDEKVLGSSLKTTHTGIQYFFITRVVNCLRKLSAGKSKSPITEDYRHHASPIYLIYWNNCQMVHASSLIPCIRLDKHPLFQIRVGFTEHDRIPDRSGLGLSLRKHLKRWCRFRYNYTTNTRRDVIVMVIQAPVNSISLSGVITGCEKWKVEPNLTPLSRERSAVKRTDRARTDNWKQPFRTSSWLTAASNWLNTQHWLHIEVALLSGGFRFRENKLHGLILNSKHLNNDAIGYGFLKNIFKFFVYIILIF